MKWTIDKTFNFDYGHRVWSQELDATYTGSAGTCLACRHLHGHSGVIKVFLSADNLERGMVVDFKMLGWFKDFVDNTLDHKFIIDIHDPLVAHEAPELCYDGDLMLLNMIPHDEGYWVADLDAMTGLPEAVREKYEGLVFVDFVPTSENLAAWLLRIVRDKMEPLGVDVTAVEFRETPKSRCVVSG